MQKFNESKVTVAEMSAFEEGKEIMVPLTSSLYVPGTIKDKDQVLVEIGAGYYVEQSIEKAKEYCDRKIKNI